MTRCSPFLSLATNDHHLVDEGPERGEDLLEGGLGLRDLQEAQVHLEHLLHQRVVAEIRVQLRLETQRSVRTQPKPEGPAFGGGKPVTHLESHDEDAERVQHGQADLRGHVGLQQTLAAHVCLRVGVHCGGETVTVKGCGFVTARSARRPIRSIGFANQHQGRNK